ncbi:unnamed protein product [Rotaria sp. Silwood1]|nr:unnamed protein product [Rotaria sp. Silwood1]CAF1629101.1 unnamed protein product [Rotaria sp. Silwood1]CAF3745488.1 unnamed protein product [Rotaria sp. Silwood1]CAF3806875.1 unnamed protein product [Rotaria sp. Silwood1]CAF3818637.1 unnamed protein product [Rotaria sp. Silwood1]
MNIEGSHYIMFDKQQKFYRCYFAPRNIGRHKIKFYGKYDNSQSATDVNVTVDSQWLKSEGYTDPILRRKITVGSKDVTIYAKYGEQSNYDELIKYTVQ